MTYSAMERETSINFADNSNLCYIYTCNKPLITKLDKLCKKFPNDFRLIKQDDCSKSYETNKKYISIRAPKTLTEEHKVKLQENAKKMHESN